MPGPLSSTISCILFASSSFFIFRLMLPPFGVYFMALLSRLYRIVSTRCGSNTIWWLCANGVKVSACSLCDVISRNSSLVVRPSFTMSASITPSRWLPVFILRNSISWFTSFDSLIVPRRTVCIAERDTVCSLFVVSFSAAPLIMASGVRNSWAMWVKKFSRNVDSSFSTFICWSSSKLRRQNLYMYVASVPNINR